MLSSMLRKSMILLPIIGMICLSGCQKKPEIEPVGNSDAESTFFCSYDIPVDLGNNNSGIIDSFELGHDICVIASVDDGEDLLYRVIIIDDESEQKVSSNDIIIGRAYSFCSTDNSLVACSTING